MERHRRDHENQALWSTLSAGRQIMVVKLDPEGVEVASYPAVVLDHEAHANWVAVEAIWTHQRVEIDGLVFEPGDELVEWFSPVQPFNAFGVHGPAGDLRGWYANVTYPAYLEISPATEGATTLYWHDLYLDLVGMPDGGFVVRDEDELAESGLETQDPGLHREIIEAGIELVRRFTAREAPFVQR